jgi:hypothetical protein
MKRKKDKFEEEINKINHKLAKLVNAIIFK